MRPIALMLLAIFSTIWAAEDAKPDPKLPLAAMQELKEYQADVDKIQAKAKADTAKRASEAAKVLAKAQTDATKKGDLEAALAIKTAIEALPIDRIDDLGNRIPAKTGPEEFDLSLIVAVDYGSDANSVSITDYFKEAMQSVGEFKVNAGKLDGLYGDPAVGETKKVMISVRRSPKLVQKITVENGRSIKRSELRAK